MANNRNQLTNDPEEVFRTAMDGRQSTIWTAMPGIVKAVDLTTMTVSVQPALKGSIQGENGAVRSVDMPLLIMVPLVFPSAGGFTLTMPVTINDEVLVVFASRCIDSWWVAGGYNNIPMELRMHDLSDGFAIPGIFSQPHKLTAVSATSAQLRNRLGTSYIELDATGAINLVSPVGINFIGPIGLTGAAVITGAVVVTGEVTANGIPLSTHKHTGITTGPGNSGGPIP